MRILICGDVVGRSGRDALAKRLADLRKNLALDLVVVDVDNAAHGFGVTPEIAGQILDMGADILTGGNHLFDHGEMVAVLESEKRLLRPANMPSTTPGSGVGELTTQKGQKLLVVHLLGQTNMPVIGENPFDYMNRLLQKYRMGGNVQAIVVEFHAEVTSEKNALGHFLDGRVSVVVGTHTHIPTADVRILEHGTAFQTDVGMCGDYDSVIGMRKEFIVERFMSGYNHKKFAPAIGEATICGLLVELDDKTGLATSAKPLILGGLLKSTE
ncbi:MAG: YmdB family metallophosphoesterase [Holosporaceae bacterium]|nr:YmdB family metallophosphoesterase [Holosporaceae bacterium]